MSRARTATNRFFMMSVLGTAFTGSAAAQEWPEPGAGFEWGNVADRELGMFDLAFDDLGRPALPRKAHVARGLWRGSEIS